jgi:peptide/nickel transport system permease protein
VVARAVPATVSPSRIHVPTAQIRYIRRYPLALFGLCVLLIFSLAALMAPVLPLPPPNVVLPQARFQPVLAPGHLLGTDDLGRDILSRMVWGGRPALLSAAIATLGALIPGTVIGLVSGFYGRITDAVLMRLVDVLLAFPALLLAIALVAGLGPGLRNAILAVSVVGLPTYARLTRGQVLPIRDLDYVQAARVLASSDRRIILKHILPNVMSPVIVVASLDVGQKIIALASLSFLGLGIQPPDSDWGAMLARSRGLMEVAPHAVAVPGVAIFLLVLSCNFIGDALRDMLDPRLR